MPRTKKINASRRTARYRERVFIGGSYHKEMRSRLGELKKAVMDAGFHAVVADEIQLENDGDIHHETMVQLHSCRLAIFEMSQLSGALMEIERIPDYGIHAVILYTNTGNKRYQGSRMLSTFVDQHSATILLKPYLSIAEARRHVVEWLELKRKEGLG